MLEHVVHTRCGYKIMGLVRKITFIFKILQINCYSLQHTLPPYPYTTPYEFSIVQGSAAGHQLTLSSAGPPFFISPHRQTESMSSFQHTFQFEEQVKVTGGLNLVNGGEVFEPWNALNWLKTASQRGCCELAH
jgi:hypothetical protein